MSGYLQVPHPVGALLLQWVVIMMGTGPANTQQVCGPLLRFLPLGLDSAPISSLGNQKLNSPLALDLQTLPIALACFLRFFFSSEDQ